MGSGSVTSSPLFAERLPASRRSRAGDCASVAVLGLGYVGLPTGIGLAQQGMKVTGVDVSERRLQDIREGSVDLAAGRGSACSRHSSSSELTLTSSPGALEAADAVLICVPTPVDERLEPDLRFLRAACETVVAHARRDQVIVLTSTSYVGTTRELLAQPLAERGLRAGPRGVRRVLARAHRPGQRPLGPGRRAAGRRRRHRPVRARGGGGRRRRVAARRAPRVLAARRPR